MAGSAAEESFALFLQHHGIGGWVRELAFAPPRRWRFDFAFPDAMVAVELEGVTSYGSHIGRHQSAKGFEADCEKYERALELGWTVYRVPHAWICRKARGRYVQVWRPRVTEVLKGLLAAAHQPAHDPLRDQRVPR